MGSADDHTGVSPGSRAKAPARKMQRLNGLRSSPIPGSSKRPIDLTQDPQDHPRREEELPTKPPSKLRKTDEAEKRLRPFRKQPPQSYLQRYARAQSQRMFVINRQRQGTDEEPHEVFDLAGTTGNVYAVTINKMPDCNCPDSVKGNQCKHVIYIVCNVLKAPAHLRYQLAYLSSELREIFGKAAIPSPSKLLSRNSNRKSTDGECPICFMEFESDDSLVWCKSSCGNNVHKECFQMWAQAQAGREIRCIYCRAPWKCDEETREMIQQLLEERKAMALNAEGYLNVARELGLSGERDYSTYYGPWVLRRGRTVRYGDIY